MAEALIVENDEAFALAHGRAQQSGITVVMGLRASDRRIAPLEDGPTPMQRADRDVIRALLGEARVPRVANAPTDHDDRHDEDGLPV